MNISINKQDIMKLRNLIISSFAALAAMVACQPEGEEVGGLTIELDKTDLAFPVEGKVETVSLTATQDWFTEILYSEGAKDWIVIDPETGAASAKPQTITVSALPNNGGYDRAAKVKFSIGMRSKYLEVMQTGDKGSTDALVVYFNDFDKEVATQTYGTDNKYWPYLDQFPDGWKNQTGTGVANVDYAFASMSCRDNSNSDGKYSDYSGSGKNNLLFGEANYFAVKNITLGTEKNYTLSFGTTRYAGDGDNTYNPSEFHVYVSADATKWVPLTYTFANGYKNGRWDVATSSFTLPEGTTTLNLYFKSDLGGAHRIDDLKLVVSETAGTAIDFTTGQEFEMGGGGNDNAGDSELDATAIYHNNYDAKTAVKDGNYWPYLADSEDSWQGAVGTGASTVTYAYSENNLTLRNNSNSDGSYSDYPGSGLNNIFFGKVPAWFATNNITLGGATNLTLTFGADKYIQSGDSNFSKNEYHVWLSADGGAKWVEFTDYTFAGTAAGRWNVATANFSVPAGTATISVCMVVETAASAYRLDDFKLVASETAFTAVDFTNAVAKDFSTTGGGEVTPPEGGETPEPGTITSIADVLALGANATIPAGTTIEGVVISNMDLNNLTSKKGMYVQDETGALQFYLAANHEFAFGDKVQMDLGGSTVGSYNGAVQISGLALAKITKVSSGNEVTPKTVSIDDFLANKYEGQYVAIEGVQVAETDLTKTFVTGGAHTSINMETADGKKFVVFSSKYATYGADTVPQGSGTIKGISSINNGKMQIIFAQSSDYAGLTGERFGAGSGEVTPPEGGDQGGEDPDPTPDPTPDPSGPVVATVAQFLAAAEDETVYQLTGLITSVTNTTYGNFYLKDETGEVLIYGLCSPTGEQKYWAASGAKVGDTITVQTVRTSYNGTPQGKNAIFVSLVPGEPAPEPEIPEGEAGEYDPNIKWTLGTNAYDNTSKDNNKQSATVNGVAVNNLLKLGTSKKTGDATLHVPAGTTKIGFYCVAWSGKKAQVKFSVDGKDLATITPAANSGATGNAPYTALNVADTDYYEVQVSAESAIDVKVETLDASNGRALFIGLKAL